MASEEQAGRNWAVAVVHGIGDTKQLLMLGDVTNAIRAQRPELVLEPMVRVHLPSAEAAGADASAAPAAPADAVAVEECLDDSCAVEAAAIADAKSRRVPIDAVFQHVRLGRIGDAQVRFATAYWSDISSFGDSLVKLIGSLALGGMGVRYLADCGTSGKSFLARLLHSLLMLKIWLLALGFLPLVLCTLIFSLFAFVGFYLFRNDALTQTLQYQAWFIAGGSMLAAAALSGLGISMLWRMRRERKLALPIFYALLFYATAMGLIILLDHPKTLGPTLGLNVTSWLQAAMQWWADSSENPNWADRIRLVDETGVYIAFLQLTQYVCGSIVIGLTAVVLVVLLLAWLLRIGTADQRRSMRLGAVGVTTMWLLMLLVLWPENVVTANVLNLYSPETRPLPASQHWHLNLLSFRMLEPFEIRTIDHLKALMPLIWFDVFFLVLLIAVAAIAVGLIRSRIGWARARNRDASLDRYGSVARDRPRWGPRLILSNWYHTAAILFMIAISTTALWHWSKRGQRFSERFAETPYLLGAGDLPYELFMSMANVTLFVILSIFVFLVAAHSIRLAVKLALDVVNHFATPSDQFPLRRKIRQRLVDTLDFLLEPRDKPHLVVICHSQGTVITLDTLFGHRRYDYSRSFLLRHRDTVWEPGLWEKGLKDEVASLTILTFGSPITHLYQHYFSTLYPALSQYPDIVATEADRASGRVRWFNCYRIDDYIGTYIEPSVADFPVNVPMPIYVDPRTSRTATWKAHTSYWSDDVFARLLAEPGMQHILAAPGRARAPEPEAQPLTRWARALQQQEAVGGEPEGVPAS